MMNYGFFCFVCLWNRSIGNLVEMFPEGKLRSLIMKISSPRWVVPVLPDQELECLLNYAIELTKVGKWINVLNGKQCRWERGLWVNFVNFLLSREDYALNYANVRANMHHYFQLRLTHECLIAKVVANLKIHDIKIKTQKIQIFQH